MHGGANAYARTAQVAVGGRELEALLLMKAATRLQGIRDAWDGPGPALDEALSYNRKLWTVLVASATGPDNPLPVPIKQNIANLGLFVFKQTVSAMAEPAPQKLGVLVTINREIAAGLRASSAAAA
jgi:flagellar protein FlaF